jgi:hypothetical protein
MMMERGFLTKEIMGDEMMVLCINVRRRCYGWTDGGSGVKGA